MTASERRVAIVLAAVFFLRMLGLFMLIPVFALYAGELPGATPLTIGIAIGIYGLTQALLQVPLGLLSDRIGRHAVILAGLALLAAGSLVAAAAGSILGVIAGRAIQGMGAVSGATLALAADATREQQRTKAMAIIGIAIGGAFSIAIVAGPLLDARFGLRGVFACAALMAVVAMPLVWFGTPRAAAPATHYAVPRLARLMDTRGLPLLLATAFALHALLSASFVAIPVALADGLGIAGAMHYRVYFPVVVGSLLLVAPLLRRTTDAASHRAWLLRAIALIAVAQALMAVGWYSRAWLPAALVAFFAAFNYIEASLPGMISRVAPPTVRGGTMGAYATCQFLGIFGGGLAGGAIAEVVDSRTVPAVAAVIAAAWWWLARRRLGGA